MSNTDKLKKVINKAASFEQNKDLAIAREFVEVNKDEEIARLKQVIIDDTAEIDRRTAHKAIAEAELAIYDK